MSSKATIKAGAKPGTFTFFNGIETVECKSRDDVGKYMEQMLWPLIAPALDSETITITIHYGTN
jgi:hypothetical protein